MSKKKRSEIFYNNIENHQRYNFKKKSNRNNKKRLVLALFGMLIFTIFIIFQIYINNPEVSIEKAVKAIKDYDYAAQENYLDEIKTINQILANSYSNDDKEKEEFIKANYKNLLVEVKDKEKTKIGLVVTTEVTNVNYIDVFDKVSKTNPENFHQAYIKALENKEEDKTQQTSKLILKRKLTGYKIYESREFIDGILGGALENVEE
ncbi:MAG: hypothetical protein Q4A76_03545 [Porphyromonadaceae bacterium]|nr:hypothetical protein [Porphyromonadaceae bacterium]